MNEPEVLVYFHQPRSLLLHVLERVRGPCRRKQKKRIKFPVTGVGAIATGHIKFFGMSANCFIVASRWRTSIAVVNSPTFHQDPYITVVMPKQDLQHEILRRPYWTLARRAPDNGTGKRRARCAGLLFIQFYFEGVESSCSAKLSIVFVI